VQVKKLSETVGFALFEPGGKHIELTEAGQRVYAGCGELFRVLAEMEQALAEIRGIASGHLRLAVPSAARHFAARLLGAFVQRNPGIQISLHIQERAGLLERLRNGDADIGMVVESPDEREMVTQAVVANPLVVLASRSHALARESDIPFARLALEPFLMRQAGCGTRMMTLKLFARHGFAPNIRMELCSDEAIREAVAAGLGVSILPRYWPGPEPRPADLVCLDVVGFPLESQWYFAYPVGKRLSAAARAFMDFARCEAKSVFRDCLRGAHAGGRPDPGPLPYEAKAI
jgi:DNA-binding transcriptional LysR family regulator